MRYRLVQGNKRTKGRRATYKVLVGIQYNSIVEVQVGIFYSLVLVFLLFVVTDMSAK